VAFDKDQIEQEAMKLLSKGQTDKALVKYQELLRHDPRDRRIRQRLAELYLKVGRQVEAEKHFREIVKHMMGSGQEKGAISVLKQVVRLKKDDPEALEQLGDCYVASGFPKDARKSYEKVVELTSRVYPDRAVETLRKIIQLVPGEFPLRIRLAELLEAANWSEKAFHEWCSLAKEARRMGRMDDRARFLEVALRLRTDFPATYLDAAEARLDLGDPKRALPHIQQGYKELKKSSRTMSLMARAFEDLAQTNDARKAWLKTAQLSETEGDMLARAHALTRAVECGEKSEEIVAEMGEAARVATIIQTRLHVQPWAQPDGEDQVRLVVKAQTLSKYGLGERATELLSKTEGDLGSAVTVRIALAEITADLGDKDQAIKVLKKVSGPTSEASKAIANRIAVLTGDLEALDQPGDLLENDLLEGELDDELIEDELDGDMLDEEPIEEPVEEPVDEAVDEPEPSPADALIAKGKELLEGGDKSGAIEVYREVLEMDPAHEGAVEGLRLALGSDHGADEAGENSTSLFDDGPDFGNIFGDDGDRGGASGSSFTSVGAGSAEGSCFDAEAWLIVGRFEDAMRVVGQPVNLRETVMAARAAAALGDVQEAIRILRPAMDDADEDEPGFGLGLVWLASFHARSGKKRAARRLMAEAAELEEGEHTPSFRLIARAIELLGAG